MSSVSTGTFGCRTWRVRSSPRTFHFPRAGIPTDTGTLRLRLSHQASETSGAQTRSQSHRPRLTAPHGHLRGQAGTLAVTPSRGAHRLVGEALEPPASSAPSSGPPGSARPSCPPCPSAQTCEEPAELGSYQSQRVRGQ